MNECLPAFKKEQIDFRLLGNMPVSVFGILTNLINVVVFLDPEMRASLVNHFLLALSLSDLLLLMCNFSFLIFPVMAHLSESYALHNVFPLVLWYSYPLALTTQTMGVYLTMLVSVHRYLGVCHPFRAKRWVSSRPVKITIVASVVFSILINLSTWFELRIEHCWSSRFNDTLRTIDLTELQKDEMYHIVAKSIVYPLVMFIIPFSTLSLVNYRIIVALQQSTHLRKLHSSRRASQSLEDMRPRYTDADSRVMHQFRLLKETKYSEIVNTFSRLTNFNSAKPPPRPDRNGVRDRSVTLMLLAIVAIFLLCNCIAFGNMVVETLSLAFSWHVDAELFEASVELGNILVSLNSSSSILVYLVFSSKYRVIIKHWLGLERRKHVNGVAITTAMAAQRALELSIMPDEAATRQKREERMAMRGRRMPLERRRSSHTDLEELKKREEEGNEGKDNSHRSSSKRKLLRFDTVN